VIFWSLVRSRSSFLPSLRPKAEKRTWAYINMAKSRPRKTPKTIRRCSCVCMRVYTTVNSEYTKTSYFLKNKKYLYDLSSTSLRCSLIPSVFTFVNMCTMQDHVDGGGGEEVRREPSGDHHQARHHQQGRRQYSQEGQTVHKTYAVSVGVLEFLSYFNQKFCTNCMFRDWLRVK
jgi:hypothetical protein